VARHFAAAAFPADSPLHLATLLFSSQAAAALAPPTRRLSAATTTSSSSSSSSSGGDDVIGRWRRHLAMVLANKTPDWPSLAAALGDRLLSEPHDLFAAHVAYVCAGLLPSPPAPSSAAGAGAAAGARSSGSHSAYGLLGCDVAAPRHRNVNDPVALTAFRLTEVLEWAAWRGADAAYGGRGGKSKEKDGSSSSSSGPASASFGRTLTGLFGLSAASAAAPGAAADAPDASDPSSGGDRGGGVDPARFVKMRAALCPHKLRFAMALADLGLVAQVTPI